MASTDMPVPLLDLAPLHRRLRREIDAAIAGVLDGNAFVLGETVRDFEKNAARYLGVRHAIGVASGTDALLLALKAAGIGPGDDVIVPAFSFFGTVEAVIHAGAEPVFADIDPLSLNIDPAHVATLITPATRAIVPVHLYGQAADMAALREIATRNHLVIIEDAAQAFGATLEGRHAGGFGLAGCFSFHPTKPLGGAGDGGMIVTNDDAFASRLRELRNHGSRGHYHHVAVGYNSRLDSLQAAVLDVKLRHLDAHLAERNRLANRYGELLADLPLELPHTLPERRHCHAQFTVRVAERERVREELAAAGIGCAVHYPAPLYRQPALDARVGADVYLPVTEQVCRECLSLPLYEGLTDSQQQRVAEVLARTRVHSARVTAAQTARL